MKKASIALGHAAEKLVGPFAGVPFLIKDLGQDYAGAVRGGGAGFDVSRILLRLSRLQRLPGCLRRPREVRAQRFQAAAEHASR